MDGWMDRGLIGAVVMFESSGAPIETRTRRRPYNMYV